MSKYSYEGHSLSQRFENSLGLPRQAIDRSRTPLTMTSLSNCAYVMVAAIDFGTTFSAYAFSFKSSPSDISMNKNWGDTLGFESYKTPTCVLTDPKGKFCAFGHEAEKKYSELTSDDSDGYELYRHFKMMLCQVKNISRQTVIKSEKGKKRYAMDIFAMAIKHLKSHLLGRIQLQVASPPDPAYIQWVITVPAIWTDSAKQFMREAAFQAGCMSDVSSNQLLIALEPEAASLFCRKINIGDYVMRSRLDVLPFKVGTEYLVIDAGGGTVDITAHEVLPDDQVKELHLANGGAWGGTRVDKQFLKVLKSILGEDFIKFFKTKSSVSFLSLMMAFERAKKTVKADGASKIVLPIPWSLGTDYKAQTGNDLDAAFTPYKEQGISFENGAIVFSNKAAVSLFKEVIQKVQSHIKELLKIPKLQGVSNVVLVGGFGESKVLQEALKKMLVPHNITMIVPPDAQLAVIKGAVHFGHNRKAIKSRICRKTYGTDTMHKFNPEKHDEKRKKILGNNVAWCDDVFEPFVRKGDQIETGFEVVRRKTAIYEGQDSMDIDIYCTDKTNLDDVEYIDSSHMDKLGRGVHVKMPRSRKEVMVRFLFGGTEIQVKATDKASGCKAETTVNYMDE